jgi:hypothetical protein
MIGTALAMTISAIGSVAAVAAGAASVKATQQSIKAQTNASNAAQKQQEVQSSASRRAAIREMQIKRAQTVASAQAAGVVGGSGVSGGLSSLGSQVGSNLGYSSQMSGLSREISMYNMQAQKYSDIAGFAGTVFQGLGGFGQLSNVFKPKQ